MISDRLLLSGLRLLLVTAWLLVALSVLAATIPDSPLRASPRWTSYVAAVSPEGWKFFTRSPREPLTHVFRPSAEGLVEALPPNADALNWFGIRKTSRIYGMEIEYLVARIPEDAWKTCDETLATCLGADRGPGQSVVIGTNVGFSCGDIVIEQRSLVPWAWSRSGEPVTMPGRYAHLQVHCVTPEAAGNG